MAEQGGRDSDGAGTEGMVEEQTREQQAGEGGLTRAGMEGDDSDSDGAGSGGIRDEKEQEQAGQGAGSAFGTGDGADTDGAGSGGMVQPNQFSGDE